jgi:glycosyltransferase involved in cell wall biosynthesis
MSRRVAIVTPAFYEGGGTASVARFLYEVLSQSGRYEPVIVSLATSARDEASVRVTAPRTWKQGVRVVHGRWQGINYRHVGTWISEVELFRYKSRNALSEVLHDVDLVQVVAGTPAWAAAIKKSNAPTALQVATVVRSERTSRINAQRHGLRKLWLLLMTHAVHAIEAPVLRSMSVVFVENPWMHDYVTALGGRSVLAPPGIDVGFFRPSDRPVDRGHILSVGRFADPRKNVRLLFDAYKEVCDSNTRAPKLLLAGQAPTENDLNYAYSLGLGEKLVVATGVPQSDLARMYREACMFVLSSNEEGLGLVVLEAMASGLPVVSTRSKGVEFLVRDGETGILSAVGDSHGLATAIVRLIEDAALRRDLGRRARSMAVEQFSQEICGKRFIETYDRLFEGESPQPLDSRRDTDRDRGRAICGPRIERRTK